MKNKKNRPSPKTSSQKPLHKPMHPRAESAKSETPTAGESPNSSKSTTRSVASEALPSIDAEFDTAEPLLAEVQSFLAKRTELAKRLKEEIAATELRLEQLRKTAASLMPERSPPAVKEKKPKKSRPAAKDATAKDGPAPEASDEGIPQGEAGTNPAE